MVAVRHFKVLALPLVCEADAFYWVLDAGNDVVDGYLTTSGGDPLRIDDIPSIADITGLTAALAAKADAVHVHDIDDVTGLQAALDGKLDESVAGAFGLTLLGAANVAAAKGSLAYTKGDVGLGNVDNTSDANKPVSTATQTALDLKAPIDSPVFTNIPAAPTPAQGTNTTQLATTAFVAAAIAALLNSAPGALDTLDELAAALGDDPNFATTVTNALANKQPLDSDLTAIAALTTQGFGRSLLTGADAAAIRTLIGLGSAALSASGDFQPIDADLTAIAALATTAFGRSFLPLADAAAGRTLLGLGSAALSASGDFQPIDADLTAIAALTTTAFGRSLLEGANAAAIRTLLALGTAAQSNNGDFQSADADLTAIAALTTAAFGRSLLEGANAGAVRTLLGLGTAALSATGDFQPIDADLTAIAAVATTAYGRALLSLADQAALQAAVGVGGWTQIGATLTPTGATATFNTIPQTYSDLMAVFEGISHNSGSNQSIRIEVSPDGASFGSPTLIDSVQAGAAVVYGSVLLSGYRLGAGTALGLLGAVAADPGHFNQSAAMNAAWRCTGGIQSLRFSPGSGNFDAGTIKLYGR